MLQVGKLLSSLEEKKTQLTAALIKLFQEKERWHTSLSRKIKIIAFSTKDIFPCLLTPSLTHHCNQRLLVTLQLPNPCACLWNISIWLTLYIATETAPIIIPSCLPHFWGATDHLFCFAFYTCTNAKTTHDFPTCQHPAGSAEGVLDKILSRPALQAWVHQMPERHRLGLVEVPGRRTTWRSHVP